MAVTHIQNRPPSMGDQIREIVESASGVYRTQKLAGDLFSLIAECGKLAGHAFDKFNAAATVLNNGAIGIIIPTAISSTVEFGQFAIALAKKGAALTYREGVELTQKASQSLQMIAYSGLLFTQQSMYGVAGDFLSVIEDGSDCLEEKEALQDLHAEQIQEMSLEAKTYLEESKTLHCIKLAKAVTALAGGIFGLLALINPSFSMPAIALLSLSVVTSVLALAGRIYKANMTYVLPNVSECVI